MKNHALQIWLLQREQELSGEAERMRATLYSIGLFLLALTVLGLLVAPVSQYRTHTVVTLWITLVLVGGLLGLVWSGFLNLSRLLYPVVILGLVTVLITINDGMHDELTLGYPAVIAMAGLLMNRHGVIGFTVLSMLVVGIVGTAHALNWLPNTTVPGRFISIVQLDMMVALSGALINQIIGNLNFNLVRLRQQEQSLSASNHQLQAIRNSLEEQVAERTARAETARQEAEAARHELEVQMWQVQGLAELSVVLRGEQDITSLAQRVMGFLCRRLDLPAGALYIREENRLRFAGGFACTPGVQTPAVFEWGEGLVGQAAASQKTSILANITADQITVVSGLWRTVPKSLLVMPLVQEEEVCGVLELAALGQFSPRAVQFLERCAESISVALHSASTRTRLRALLDETQRQAEELQAQEEELRTANEELLAQAENMRQRWTPSNRRME